MAVAREEAFSFFTHLGGAIVGAVGLVFLLLRAETTLARAAFAVYGVTLVLMFLSSTFHHVAHREGGLARRMDMSAIYLFIAGTYTPATLLALPPEWGVPIFAIVWVLSSAGVLLLAIKPKLDRRVAVGLYLALGWMALAVGWPLSQTVPWEGLGLVVAGGIVYSVGAVVYWRKSPDPWPTRVGYHGLWHVFVLVGAAFHFALIWFYVPTG